MRYNYTTDWNPSCRYSWLSLLNTFKDKTNLQFLEIGCWEGRTTNWLLDNFLTHISSKITVIDTFKGSEEEPGMRNQDLLTIRERFNHNTSAHSKKINVLEGFSNHRLKELGNEPLYDFVFIDGTHTSYMWINHDSTSPTDSPKLGIDSFLENYCDFYKILDKKVQVTIQKNN